MTRRLIVIVAIAIGSIALGCQAPGLAATPGPAATLMPSTHTFAFTATFPAYSGSGATCIADGTAWDPLTAGGQAKLLNEKSETLGVATVRDLPDSKVGGRCHVGFEMPDIPDARFYKLTINDVEIFEKPAAEVNGLNWKVDLEYASPF